LKNRKSITILGGVILLIFYSLNLANQTKTENSLQTQLLLSIDIIEIKIKDIREDIFDSRGEFYFYREIGSEKVRLPSSGEIKGEKNEYFLPTDSGLENEPFWHKTWQENQDSFVIKFQAWEKDDISDDDMGSLSAAIDLTNFQFLSENINRKLDRGDYHIRFTITCAPVISSATHPDSAEVYNNQNAYFEWTLTRPAGGILGYSYILDDSCCTEPDDIIEGTHTSTSYSNLTGGTHWFHIKSLDKAGFRSNTGHFKINITKSIDVPPTAVNEHHFQLFQNYPNPFNSKTVISYRLARPAQVEIRIFNLTGQLINTLRNSFQAAGFYKIVWDGKNNYDMDVSSGTYVYIIKAGQIVKTNKMMLLR